MAEVSPHTKQKVLNHIVSDLRPSLFVIYAKSGLAVALGGFLSLLFCGQFGVGVTQHARHLSNHLHSSVENLACVILCGTVFAVAPAIVLRVLTSPLQFRVITRHSFHAPLLWFGAIGGLLSYHGEHGRELLSFVVWCVTAWMVFEGLSRILELFPSKLRYRNELGF